MQEMIPKKALRWTSQGFRKWHGRVGSVLQTGRISCTSFQFKVSMLLLMHTIAKFEVFVAFNPVNLSVALCASSNFYREIQIRHFCPPFCCRLGALWTNGNFAQTNLNIHIISIIWNKIKEIWRYTKNRHVAKDEQDRVFTGARWARYLKIVHIRWTRVCRKALLMPHILEANARP